MSNAAQAACEHGIADPERVAIRGTAGPWTYGRLSVIATCLCVCASYNTRRW